jgi:transcriptional regulator with XRE-family HTH domain
MPISSPHPVDTHVGERLRIRRKFLGMSQSELAQTIGLTFQQVQKYERGTNRISASKLFEASAALKVPIAYFFQSYEPADTQDGFAFSASEKSANEFLVTSEGIELAKTFPKIVQPKLRRRLIELIHVLGDGDA